MTPLRVVTLPPHLRGREASLWASRAARLGAEVIEVRNDLHSPGEVDLGELARSLRVLCSERAGPLPEDWLATAWRVDVPLGSQGCARVPAARLLLSHHAPSPLSSDAAAALWAASGAVRSTWVKHVEPLGELATASRLLATQRALNASFSRATTLVTGTAALPFRALAAAANALDYLSLDDRFEAAPGQRRLGDAVRCGDAGGPRLGILGAGISASRSPRVHPQPFDRIELPADADVPALLEALLPYYRGLAVTSPFKRSAARAVGAGLPAINCLYRSAGRWHGANTDVEGARVALRRLAFPGGAAAAPCELEVLGDGGATEALRVAASLEGLPLRIRRRAELEGSVVRAPAIWTWPEAVEPPPGMVFAAAEVGIIAYGGRARRIAQKVRALGGRPRYLGGAWFCTQARAQGALWESAT